MTLWIVDYHGSHKSSVPSSNPHTCLRLLLAWKSPMWFASNQMRGGEAVVVPTPYDLVVFVKVKLILIMENSVFLSTFKKSTMETSVFYFQSLRKLSNHLSAHGVPCKFPGLITATTWKSFGAWDLMGKAGLSLVQSNDFGGAMGDERGSRKTCALSHVL